MTVSTWLRTLADCTWVLVWKSLVCWSIVSWRFAEIDPTAASLFPSCSSSADTRALALPSAVVMSVDAWLYTCVAIPATLVNPGLPATP